MTRVAIPSRRLERGGRGFTLIEVLVALVILSTGIVLVLRAFGTSLEAVGRSRDVLLASMLIRQKIEQVEAQLRAAGDWAGNSSETLSDPRYKGFRRQWEAAPADLGGTVMNTGRGTLYRVRVAAFEESMGQEQSATTYVYVPAKTNDAASSLSATP